jgi:tetratricopeptide (TPR) repeat protein
VNRTAEDWWAAVRRAGDLPFGPERTTTLEQLIAETVDAPGYIPSDVLDAVGTAARIGLITSYVHDGAHPAALTPFTWLLTRYDAAPPWLGERERHGILWTFRWMTAGMTEHPEVSRERVESTLDGMADRFARAGEGPAPVLACRFEVRAAFEGAEAAHADYLAWIAAPRTSLSACAACERSRQAEHLAAIGLHDDAVRAVRPVLDGELSCPDQPAGAIAEVLESMLRRGDLRRAAAEHAHGVRLLRGVRPGQAHARHLMLCARAGRLPRGLDLLEQWLPRRAATPLGQLRMAIAGGRLLRGLAEAGQGALTVTPRPVPAGDGDGPEAQPATVSQLQARLTQQATALAARFDERNHTGVVGADTRAALESGPLPDLPIEALRRPGWPMPADALTGALAVPAPGPPVDPAALAAAGDVTGMAAAFDAAARAESDQERLAVLAAWRLVRGMHAAPNPDLTVELAAARLDGWLAVERLLGQEADLDDLLREAQEAGRRLRAAGADTEAALHDQVVKLAAVRPATATAEDAAAVESEITALTLWVLRGGDPAQAGVALSRLVAARQLAAPDRSPDRPAAHGGDATPDEAFAISDPVAAGIALLSSVPRDDLDHQQLRALARLLRVRAGTEPADFAVATLREAVAALPTGVRPRERALARVDLAATLQAVDATAAVDVFRDALDDAARARDDALRGSLLGSLAGLRHTIGDVEGAADDLTRALPLLDKHGDPLLAAQARCDLARALLDAGRVAEAAEAAEGGLDLVSRVLAADGVTPADPDEPPPDVLDLRADIHLAGTCAFAAAEAACALGEGQHARDLAELSAGWHRSNGNLVAEAEAWQLLTRCGGSVAENAAALGRAAELADASGDWARAATCRREQATAVHEADGPDAALAVVDDAVTRLEAEGGPRGGRHADPAVVEEAERQLQWHRLALAEQRVRLLALAGRFPDALGEVADIEAGYRDLDDAWSARDVVALRGQIRAELGQLDAGITDLTQAAEEALASGDTHQTRELAVRLAAVLDDAGRPEDAEKAWRRFSGEE